MGDDRWDRQMADDHWRAVDRWTFLTVVLPRLAVGPPGLPEGSFGPTAIFEGNGYKCTPNRPKGVWKSEETCQGCCYTILELFTCIVLSDTNGD